MGTESTAAVGFARGSSTAEMESVNNKDVSYGGNTASSIFPEQWRASDRSCHLCASEANIHLYSTYTTNRSQPALDVYAALKCAILYILSTIIFKICNIYNLNRK